MNYKAFFAMTAASAVVLATTLTPASAQTLTVTGSSSLSGGVYTYSYVVTPVGTNFNINQLIFNFADNNFTGTPTSNGPLVFTSSNASAGLFTFSNATTPLTAGTTETFTFTSPDAPGGTLGATAIAYNGSGVAATPGVTPAPAPEPGSLASMAVLGTCLGLGIVARRRKQLSA